MNTDINERAVEAECLREARDLFQSWFGERVAEADIIDALSLSEREARDLAYELMDLFLFVDDVYAAAKSVSGSAFELRKKLTTLIPRVFAAADMPRGDRGGKSFFPSEQLYVSAGGGVSDPKLLRWLSENGFEAAVKEQVNTNTLKSIVREVKEENGGVIPDDLAALLKVSEVTELSVRRA